MSVVVRIGFAALMLSASAGAQSPAPTAAQVVATIREHAGVSLPERTVDTFKAGEPNTRITGVAVTMMATLEVLKEASGRGLNLVITHEPTFYSHRDTTSMLEAEHDPVLAAKQRFISDHGMIVWRFHDIPHAMRPDMIRAGMIHALGWEKRSRDSTLMVFDVEPIRLRDLARYVSARLGAHAVRISGDPSTRVSHVAFTQGFPGFAANRRAIQSGQVDVLVMGEDHEWETIEYAVDGISAGQLKGLIVLGHIPSEQEGMRMAAEWMRSYLKGIRVEFVLAPDPFITAR